MTIAFLKGDSFEARLRATLEVWFDAADRGPIIAALFDVARLRAALGDRGHTVRDEDAEFWQSYLCELFGISASAATTVAAALYSLLEGAIHAWQDGGVDRDEVIDTMVRFCAAGLRGLAEEPPAE